jgi:translation initiation factor IF-2
MKVGDYVLAGQHSGKVKAMLDERGNRIKVAGPSTPVNLLGLDGAPTSGDRFIIMDDEREAKQIAQKRLQLQREQSVRSQKQMTLEEIGRRLKVGDFQELNIILKGDVDGSVEALSDSLQKLTTEEIQVNIIHKGVGQISESDVLLATASQAIVVGFQVRPSAQARKLAEKEEVEIRMYSIIYDAINEVRDAMEGMLSAEVKEEIKGTAEIRETFKISKVGTIAGCMVTDGVIERNNDVRIIRDGVVVYTGKLGSLKRFKDDAKEVRQGFECGLNIEKFNDIKVGDIVEAFGFTEVKRTL